MFHIGVLAHSLEGAAECTRGIRRAGHDQLGPDQHPELTLSCIPMGESMDAWQHGRLDEIRTTLSLSLARLRAAGADFFVCPDNTAHLALEQPGPELLIPGLHIATVLAHAAHERGHATIGILGTRWTMQSDLYSRACEPLGIRTITPGLSDQATVHSIIFGDLVHGNFPARARDACLEVIEHLRRDGCEAIALACTELPLLVPAGCSPLPVLSSTDLLAETAVATATGSAPYPSWRGGRCAQAAEIA